jgi:hypothetical protein
MEAAGSSKELVLIYRHNHARKQCPTPEDGNLHSPYRLTLWDSLFAMGHGSNERKRKYAVLDLDGGGNKYWTDKQGIKTGSWYG